jgi:hypothetical protein
MRRSWAVLFTTGILVGGGVLTAGPATAAGPSAPSAGALGAMVQPGGPAQRMTSAPSDRAAAAAAQTTVSSTNWAGYAATGTSGQFTSVSASWVEPAGHCGSGDQYSAFWAGLDGYSSSTVEQTGSEVGCVGRGAEYSAWYEMYPANPVYFGIQVRPGDHFTGSVAYQSGNFVLTLTDSNENWSQTVTQTRAGAARSSAEVIAEAPSSSTSGGVLPLTNFGTVNFSGATVNGAGLCQSGPVEITMPHASVSALSGCTNFSVS